MDAILKQHRGLARQGGFSLVELLVAMAIGMFLLSGAVLVFSSSKSTFRANEAVNKLQEISRFSLDVLGREVRNAGYTGCAAALNLTNVLDDTSPNYQAWSFDMANALSGYDDSQPASFPASISASVVAGTDALVITGMDETAFTILNHTQCSATFSLYGTHDFQDDEVAMVSDCKYGAIFQITNANPSNGTIVHNTGTGSIGNTSRCLGNCGGGCSGWHQYQSDAVLTRLRSTLFHVRLNNSGEPALYQEKVRGSATPVVQELISGVENMQILYGLDNDGDGVANQYMNAATVSATAAWTNVVTVRIGLLIRSTAGSRSQLDTSLYSVLGTSIGTTTAISHPVDRRLRQVITTTIQVRNRG